MDDLDVTSKFGMASGSFFCGVGRRVMECPCPMMLHQGKRGIP